MTLPFLKIDRRHGGVDPADGPGAAPALLRARLHHGVAGGGHQERRVLLATDGRHHAHAL